MSLLETERLVLRRLREEDAAFILELLNDPAFLQHIGDRGVRTEEQARAYLRDGPMASYEAHGFGLYLVARKADGAPIGISGLVKRDGLADVDIGYALLPPFRAQGYALESGRAVLAHAREAFGLERVVAIVQPDNAGSIRVLERLGMTFERMVRLAPEKPEVMLYACALGREAAMAAC